jgi:uncharacterized FlaG/YvyC family protein
MNDEYRLLPCVLSDEQIQTKGEELAEAELARQRLVAEKKAAAAAFKEPISEQVDLITKLSKEISEEVEMRDVQVNWRPDFDNGVVDCVRADTGEVVESRPMVDSDRQGTLDVGTKGVN